MTIYTRPDDQVFAANALAGELDPFPDLGRGWGVTLDTTNGIPPMEYFNALQNRTDKAVAYLMQRGVAEWSASTEYPFQAITIKNGQVFFAKQRNSNKDPERNPDYWVNSFAQKADKSELEGLTENLIGSVAMFAFDAEKAPDGFLWCDGGLYNPGDYPKLFAKIGYTWGRSGSKFATPSQAEDNRFPRCAGGSLSVGTTQTDAIRNIKGEISSLDSNKNDYGLFTRSTGAFKVGKISEQRQSFAPAAGGTGYGFLELDTSLAVPTADENRPNAIVYKFAIRYK